MKISINQSIRYKRYLWCIAFATTFALAVGWWWYLLDSGYCVSQMRYLSNEELIVKAIRYNADDMKIDGSDASITEFLKKNPKCCYVDRHPSSRKFFEPLGVCFGFNYSEVTLNYEKANPRSLTEPFYENYISISACGDKPHSDYGMSHSTLQKIN